MRLALLALLLSLPAAGQGFGLAPEFSLAPEFGPPGQAMPELLLLSPGQVAVSPLMCTAAGQLNLLSGSYACLNGDGTQDSSSGMALSAVGSPTTQTMETSPNGSNNRAVSRQVVSASSYWQTPSVASPSGDWSACGFGIVDAPISARYIGQSTSSWWLQATSTGTLQVAIAGGTTVSSASGAVTGGADHLPCVTFHYVGSGNVNTVTLYIDGAQAGQNTTEPPLAAVSAPITFGQVNGVAASRLRGAFFTSKALTPTDVQRLQAALVPVPQTATGQSISNSRNSATWVTTSGGALVALPPGRTGVVGPPGETGVVGGVVSSPSRTTINTFSDQIDNAAYSVGTATATANTTTAPDGSLTADTVTAGTAGAFRGQALTSSGGAATLSIYAKTASGTQSVKVEIYDATSAASLGSTTCTATTSWPTTPQGRCIVNVTSTTSGHSIQFRFYPAGAGTGSVYAFRFQAEWSAVANAPCLSEGTSATCAGDAITVPTPGWLSTKEGCMRACLTPSWTGTTPAGGHVLTFGSTNGRVLSWSAGGSVIYAYNGTVNPGVATTFTAGARRCYVTRWSASAGTLGVTDLTTGTTDSDSGFTGWPSIDSVLHVGHEGTGGQPLGSIIDSVTLGSSPGGCR